MIRPIYLSIDGKSWLQAYPVEGGGWRVQRHYPRRETSVGYIDKPLVAHGRTPEDAVRSVFAAAELTDSYPVDDLAAALAERCNPEPAL